MSQVTAVMSQNHSLGEYLESWSEVGKKDVLILTMINSNTTIT